MVVCKEILTNLKEKCEKAYKLVDEESKNDPPTDPFRSHYVARDILVTVMENLKNSILSESNPENQLIYKIILGFVYRDLGRINVFCEEVPTGEKYLQSCLELIEDYRLDVEGVIPFVGCLNELGIIWATRENPLEAEKFLKRSEETYEQFKKLNKKPLALYDIFGTMDEIEIGKGSAELEKLYTLTTFYMAQVLKSLENFELSAKYCNLTLRNQLLSNNYDAIDWSLNAASLSQYYIGPNKFTEARHHLAAATYIMDKYEETMITDDMTEQAKADTKETFQHRYADVARCWGKYGLALLSASKENLMNDSEEKLIKEISSITISEDNKFNSLCLTSYECRITDELCLTIEDARKVFQFVISWLDIALKYYRAETEASEYAKIIIDYADLYKQVAFFDEDSSNQCKMFKKSAVFYEDLLKILNPKYYLVICRECWYNCASSYSSILDIKLDIFDQQLKFSEKPTPHALHKINMLCDKAISNFNEFIKTYQDKSTNTLIANISTDEKQIVLYSYFHLGRLFYKIVTPNKNMQLSNLRNSLKYYKEFVDGCEADQDASATLKGEIGVCKEMIVLLPLKIQKTVNEIQESLEN